MISYTKPYLSIKKGTDVRNYVILGSPVPLARPRIAFKNKRVYDSQKNIKLVVGIDLQNQHGDQPLFKGPLHLDIIFFMPVPSTISTVKRKKLIGSYHTSVPDIDNLVKILLDISQGILFENDAFVASISTKKVYDENPRTEFSLKNLDVKHAA